MGASVNRDLLIPFITQVEKPSQRWMGEGGCPGASLPRDGVASGKDAARPDELTY